MLQVAEKINITVLVAPLDWGLGHCTRCVPIIHHLLQTGCKVILAAEGAQERLLRIEFPSLEILPLPGYRITYSSNKRLFAGKILWQVPKIVNAIKQENKWLDGIVKNRSVDIIISDNRYGLHHPTATSVFITHQLRVQAPFQWMEILLQKMVYRLINQFSVCWVPDAEGKLNLAGRLSHPKKLPAIPLHYIGPLSRMESVEAGDAKYDILILLSGPEPQRSMLEQQLIQQLAAISLKVLLIRGLPISTESMHVNKNVEVINHLPAKDLQVAIASSAITICRSGYSTIMDICKLQKSAILIPTPGQTEQEYLARHLHQQGWCLYYEQENFSLQLALQKAAIFTFRKLEINMNHYQFVIDKLIEEQQSKSSLS